MNPETFNVMLKFFEKVLENQKEYECKFCLKSFIDIKQLEIHSITTHLEERFVCDFCSSEYKLECNIFEHIDMMHMKLDHQHLQEVESKKVVKKTPKDYYEPKSKSKTKDSDYDKYNDEGKRMKKPDKEYPRKCDHMHMKRDHQHLQEVELKKVVKKTPKDDCEPKSKSETKDSDYDKNDEGKRMKKSDKEYDRKCDHMHMKRDHQHLQEVELKKVVKKTPKDDCEPKSKSETKDSDYDKNDEGKRMKKSDKEYDRKCDHMHMKLEHRHHQEVETKKVVKKTPKDDYEPKSKSETKDSYYDKYDEGKRMKKPDKEYPRQCDHMHMKLDHQHLHEVEPKIVVKKTPKNDYEPKSKSETKDSDYNKYDDEGKRIKKPDKEYPMKCDHMHMKLDHQHLQEVEPKKVVKKTPKDYYEPKSKSETKDSDYDKYDDEGKRMKKPDKEYPMKCDHMHMKLDHQHLQEVEPKKVVKKTPKDYYEPKSKSETKDSDYDKYDDEGKRMKKPDKEYPMKCDHPIGHPLKAHETEYSGIKVQCTLCEKHFDSVNLMKKHIKHDHILVLFPFYKWKKERGKEDKPYKCHICGTTFAHSSNRQLHIRSAHQNFKQMRKQKQVIDKQKNKVLF